MGQKGIWVSIRFGEQKNANYSLILRRIFNCTIKEKNEELK
jgi:hypothetical protein